MLTGAGFTPLRATPIATREINGTLPFVRMVTHVLAICALEGVDAQQYQNTYGITSIPGGVRLGFVTGANVGSRLFSLGG